MFSFWLVWSGKYYPFYIAVGAACSLLVAVWFGDLIVEESKTPFLKRVKAFFRFEMYSLWLLIEIVYANIHVVKVAFSLNVKDVIDPRMIEFKTTLSHSMEQFLLAQSITLTPGTVSVRIKKDMF